MYKHSTILSIFVFIILVLPFQTFAQSKTDSLTQLINKEKNISKKHALYLERAVEYEKEDSVLAFKDVNTAFDYYKKNKESRGMVDAYIARGKIYFKLRNHQKAIREDSLAMRLAQKINYEEGTAVAIGRLGLNQYILMNLSEAEKNLAQAIKLEKELESNDFERLVNLYGVMGVVKRELGKYGESIAVLEEGIKIGENLSDKQSLIRIY